MFGADTFCTRIGNQDRPRATRTGIVAKDEPRQEENLGPGNLFLLTGGGHIEVRQRFFHIEWFFICHSNFGCPIRLTRGAAIKFRIAASAKSKNSPRRTSSFMSKEPPTPLYLG